MEMDKRMAETLGKETADALVDVAKRHGLTVAYQGGRYDPTEGTYRPKIEYRIASADQERRSFDRWGAVYGIDSSYLGETFVAQGRTFTVSGINPRSKTRPLMAKDERGKVFVFDERMVERLKARRTVPSVPA